jgi:hypothetical protein
VSAPVRLTERQRELVAKATETASLTFSVIAEGMPNVDMSSLAVVYQATCSRTKVRLAEVLAVVGELTAAGPGPETGVVTLTAEQLEIVLGALADAQTYRELAGRPDEDETDFTTAREYGNLAARLLGGGAR